MSLPEKKQRYTYADYCTWDGDERWELFDGEAYALAAPLIVHQRIIGNLHLQFATFLKDKPCEVFIAPVDVLLNAAGDNDDDVVQPDLVVVCDHAKITEKYINGAPDAVIEVLSPSTSTRDKFLKFNKYQNTGVREYWIVDPDSKTVQVHILETGRYFTKSYGETGKISVHVLEGCEISLSDVFSELAFTDRRAAL